MGPGHLPLCQKYLQSNAEGDNTPPKFPLDSRDPNCNSGSAKKRSFRPVTMDLQKETPQAKGQPITKITPPAASSRVPQNSKEAATAKKPRSSAKESSFRCMACGKNGCPYDNGYTVLDDKPGQEYEYDPWDPLPADLAPTFCFDRIKSSIRIVVAAAIVSKGFWSVHKFIGSQTLDMKLTTWMKQRLNDRLVDDNRAALRRAVMEALRYKRQESIRSIKTTFFGTFSMLLSFLPELSLQLLHL